MPEHDMHTYINTYTHTHTEDFLSVRYERIYRLWARLVGADSGRIR